jgi:hypothetical protein
MSINVSPNRIALRPGEQGARSPAGNQAGTEKLATGMSNQRQNHRNSRNTMNFLEFFDHQQWPQFFLVNGVNERLDMLDPITIAESIEDFIGEPEDTRMLRSGSLLVQCKNQKQSEKIESLKIIDEMRVKVIQHARLNSCKGVVLSHESYKCTDEKLKGYLDKKHGIKEVYRMKPRADNSQLIIVTFPNKCLPKRIKIGHERCGVRPYVPNPSRCYNCQRFGHMSRNCKRRPVCAKCGSEDHVHIRENPCQKEAHCVNCNQNHPAYDRSCPKWETEKNILKLKVTKDISFPEARRLVEQHGSQLSYAAVAATSVADNNSHSQRNFETNSRSSPKRSSSNSHGFYGPRSSPRSTPHHRLNLSPNKTYSKYSKQIDKAAVLASASDHFKRLDFAIENYGTELVNPGKRKSRDSPEEGSNKSSRVHPGESDLDSSMETVVSENKSTGDESENDSHTEENLETKVVTDADSQTKIIPEKETVTHVDPRDRVDQEQQPDTSITKSYAASVTNNSRKTTPPQSSSRIVSGIPISKGTTSGNSTKNPTPGSNPKNGPLNTKKSVTGGKGLNRSGFKPP